MPSKDTMFICACPKHGVDIHDGTKNECCDAAVILPMLDNEGYNRLVEEGKKQFRGDLRKLAELVESKAIELHDEDAGWYSDLFPLVEADLAEAQMTKDIEEEGSEEDTTENTMEFNPQAFYMEGFEAGFAAGFDKGFDAGNKLSVLKK